MKFVARVSVSAWGEGERKHQAIAKEARSIFSEWRKFVNGCAWGRTSSGSTLRSYCLVPCVGLKRVFFDRRKQWVLQASKRKVSKV